ncbi:MAG: hypothetical protein R6U29_06845, partial [Desulfosudaceae bacterium]
MRPDQAYQPIVIMGLGQMGGVFARGFLGAGHPVYPVTPAMNPADRVALMPEPVLVLLAVPENILTEVLSRMPGPWRDRLGLLQNELLPWQWQAENITNPTVLAVWFEKKSGREVKVFQPSQAFGPGAELIREALGTLDIPCQVPADEGEMLTELIKKNLYVLTINIAGLVVGGKTGELWAGHSELVTRIAGDIIDIMEAVNRTTCDRPSLLA